jgi:hypothetical protein
MIKIRRRLCNVFALLSLNTLAQDVPPSWAFKMTPSVYSARQQPTATDLNLRGHWGQHTVWVGHYTRPGEFQQTRSGYEFNADMGGIQVTPSLQAASHGFWGGSLNATVGETVYGLVGWGRTNLKDYYNLNFDPNDAVTWGLGWRVHSNNQFTLFKIKDNRLHTDQEVTHGVWRYNANAHQRWTVDLSQKQGRSSQGLALVQGNAWSLAYDHHALFFKIARDQKVNFSDIDQWRVALGWRF